MSAGPEDILQMQVIRALKIVAPDCLVYHAANGGSRHPAEARKLKDMGVMPGVADLCFVLPGGGAGFIELKAGKGRQSPSQKAFQETATDKGALYAVCRSLDEVLTTLKSWAVPMRARGAE